MELIDFVRERPLLRRKMAVDIIRAGIEEEMELTVEGLWPLTVAHPLVSSEEGREILRNEIREELEAMKKDEQEEK